jgi:hypothetical protein
MKAVFGCSIKLNTSGEEFIFSSLLHVDIYYIYNYLFSIMMVGGISLLVVRIQSSFGEVRPCNLKWNLFCLSNSCSECYGFRLPDFFPFGRQNVLCEIKV